MVLKPTRRRPQRGIVARNVAIFVVCMAASYTAMRFIMGQTLTEFVQQNIIASSEMSDKKAPAFIDMQDIVDSFATQHSGKVSVVVYDLDNERYSAIYNSDAKRETASLYKLFPVYEEYLRMEDGRLGRDEILYRGTGSNGYSRAEYSREKCADLAIRESHSACAEKMVEEIGQEELDEIGRDYYELTNTSGLTSTASDVMKMLKVYYEHDDLSEETWAKIKDSMLNQPNTKSSETNTENKWRQGLPSGFHTANVYNKVGWQGEKDKWKVYNDAAIVEFADLGRHYIVVVMTADTAPTEIAKLGESIERTVLAAKE